MKKAWMNRIKVITEFGYIGYGDSFVPNSNFISQSISRIQFQEIEEFHKENKDIFEYVNNHTLKAKGHYVGVIQTPSLTLEILPKIYNDSKNENGINKYRKIFLKMLLKIDDIPTAKDGTTADVNVADMNVFEVFIKLFAKHVENLIQKGVKSDYIFTEDNLTYLKGKLQFSNHIRYNLAHKERFYVEYDEYMEDRVENRLLKTCINFLLAKTKDFDNQKKLRQQLFFFANVSDSTNVQYDLSHIEYLQRGMEHYELPLKFAKIFLNNKSFAPIKGDNSSFSLLFQMNIIFERYIEKLLQENTEIRNLQTKMKGKYHLLTNNKIALEPDYKFELDSKLIIGDAKWKLIDQECTDKLNPSDIYQIYSYLNYFNSKVGYIFTPLLNSNEELTKYEFQSHTYTLEGKQLYIKYINLESDTMLSLN